ncbi:MAG TPA: hypothetical protein PLD95_01655 [bacterium]|jgi:hypothetical protein|nr:hypothetical protein [bacterium]HOG38154.1 hypothetical protein [bacterium]HQI03374.1 hypothetical protein [bacterium]
MKKDIFLLLKILMVCVVLSLIVLSAFLYSNKKNQDKVIPVSQQKNQVERQITKEELIANYKSGVLTALNSFNNDYQETRNKLDGLSVPLEFKDQYFNLVTAFDEIIYNNDKDLALKKLETISRSDDWIKEPLQKIIESLK